MKGRPWTQGEIETLEREYPTVCGKVLAEKLDRSHIAVCNMAHFLGIKKSAEFKLEASKRIAEIGKKYRYPKGNVPANKGKKMEEFMPPEVAQKFKANMYKKGRIPHNALPVGTESIHKDKAGRLYKTIKVEGKRKLVFLHVHLWEQANGKVQKGHNIIFKDGNTMNCTIDNLECITNAELMRRNIIHRYPPELKDQIRKLAKIKKIIKKLDHE
jgi:hypothetical protein